MLVPLHGFVAGDTLGLVVLVHDTDRVQDVAERLQEAASVRVAPRQHTCLYVEGRPLDPELTVAAAGLGPLDRVDLVPDEREDA
jgi:Toluene-4-monooxygenase system protein B (TmoB)